jgi:CDP-diglyceride synthetase
VVNLLRRRLVKANVFFNQTSFSTFAGEIQLLLTMHHILFIATVIACASFLALLEIQIEGAAGWAGNLPTWKISNRMTRLFLGSVPFTGYHLYLSLYTLCFLHVPFLAGITPFSVPSELKLCSFYLFFWVTEDFLWFAFNPAFGLKKFRKENIWWHAGSWWIFMPKLYWILLPAGAILYFLSLQAL